MKVKEPKGQDRMPTRLAQGNTWEFLYCLSVFSDLET